MKSKSVAFGSLPLLLFTGMLLTLATMSIYLYQQNRLYQNINRELIIQNDSILSANIELANTIKQQAATPTQLSSSRLLRNIIQE